MTFTTSQVEYLYDCYDYVTGQTYTFGQNGKCEISLNETTQFRNGTYDALDTIGGIDPLGIYGDPQSFRTIRAQYEYIYQPGDTFTSVWDNIYLKIGQGNGLRLSIVAADGTTRYIDGKITVLDKKSAIPMQFSVVIPFTFVAPNPLFYSKYKPGIDTLDSGLLLDAGGFNLDRDPDRYTIGSSYVTHSITNSAGTAPDEAVVVYLIGPILADPTTGYIVISNSGRTLLNGNPEYVVYKGGVASGETLTIDCGNFDVSSSIGVDAYSLFAWPLGQLSWLSVSPGSSQWIVQSGGGGGNVIISWKPRFRG